MRGDIVDRNGELIVGSKLAPTLYFMPSQNMKFNHAAIALPLYLERMLLLLKRSYLRKNIW